jgi:iron-sulfur cluster assembly protein
MLEEFIPITLSDRAAEEVRRIMARKGIPPDYGLRVGVRGGGCGVSLLIGFDKKKDSDLAYSLGGIPVYVDKKHTLYVAGKQVDFYEGEEGRGFTFVNQPTHPSAV